jgi:hypothetical protein
MPASRPDLPQMEAGHPLCGVQSGLGNDVQALTAMSIKRFTRTNVQNVSFSLICDRQVKVFRAFPAVQPAIAHVLLRSLATAR